MLGAFNLCVGNAGEKGKNHRNYQFFLENSLCFGFNRGGHCCWQPLLGVRREFSLGHRSILPWEEQWCRSTRSSYFGDALIPWTLIQHESQGQEQEERQDLTLDILHRGNVNNVEYKHNTVIFY